MGTLTINGKRVKVDDSFALLSPADQQRTVEEIAAQMGGQQSDPGAALDEKLARPFGANPAPMPEQNNRASVLPGPVGQFQNTSNAAQAGFNQGLTLGFGDELYAGATAPFRALPGLVNGQGYDLGGAYEAGLQMQREGDRQAKALNPVAAGTGEITGAILNPIGRAFGTGKAATTMGNVGRGLAEGATLGGAYGFGSAEGDLGDRARGGAFGAGTGALLGAAVPFLAKKGGDVVEGLMQNRATSQAIKNAPSADDLSSAASQLFETSRAAGVGVKPQVFGTFARDTAAKARAMDIDPELDQAAWTVYERLIERAKQGFADPGSLTLSRLHNLRQMAQDVVIEAKKPRTKGFAQQIVDGLDDMIGKLKPADLNFPANRIGGANAKDAGNALLDGIGTWAKARRVGLIEQAIAKAQNYPSGVESGLRSQFRTLLNGKNTSKLFTKAERQAMQAVVNGTAPVTALRALGIFRGLGGAVLGSALGGPLGTVVGGAAGIVGRKITEKATENAAQRAAQVVATKNIPSITFNNPLRALPGGPFALPAIDMLNQRQAIPQR